jgi:hypothetical protein
MFVLIVEHDYAEWDVMLHAKRAEAEQVIRDLAQAKWDEDGGAPRHTADCIDYLATCNEHIKVFLGTPGAVSANKSTSVKRLSVPLEVETAR